MKKHVERMNGAVVGLKHRERVCADDKEDLEMNGLTDGN